MVEFVKAQCPTCGEVDIRREDVRLNVCSIAHLSHYGFHCPSCGQSVSKPADEHIVSLLIAGGIPANRWHVPLEVMEPRGIGAAITYDDLLTFALDLAEVDDLAELAA